MDGNRSSGMFCIVDFAGGRQRTVVPDTWLSINHTFCLLPPNAPDSEVEVLARNLAEPGEGWQMLEIRSLERYESYSEARKQLNMSKEARQSQASVSQRKRKMPNYLEDYSTRDSDGGRKPHSVIEMEFDEEGMSENEWIPPPAFNPRIEKVSSVKKTIHSGQRPWIYRRARSQLSSRKENNDFTCGCQSSCHSTILQTLYNVQKQLCSMQKQLDKNDQTVQQFQTQTNSQLKRILQPQPVNQVIVQDEIDAFSQDSTDFAQSIDRNIEARVERHTKEVSHTGHAQGSSNSPDTIWEDIISDCPTIKAEQELRFLVVEFLEERSVAVVPSNWEQNGFCFWPPARVASEGIEKMVLNFAPPEDDWQKTAVDVKYSADSYDLARRRLKEAQETSGLATRDFSKSERKRGRIEKSLLPTSEEKNSSCTIAPRLQPSTASEPQVDNLIENMIQLKSDMAIVQDRLTTLQSIETYEGLNTKVDDFKQLKSVEDLNDFEDKLFCEEEFLKRVKICGFLGGVNYKEAVRRILQKILSHEVALQLSWKQTPSKISIQRFPNLLLFITASVRSNPPFSKVLQNDIEEIIKRWLRHAPDRNGGRTERKRKKAISKNGGRAERIERRSVSLNGERIERMKKREIS